MRAGNTYRGAKKREAKARGLDWKTLDKVSNRSKGYFTVTVKYPFERLGRRV